MKLTRWSALAALVFVGCQFSASCGGNSIDMKKANDFVSSTLETSAGVKPSKVTCPDSVKPVKDATFDCTAEMGKATAKVTIKQLDDKGNVQISAVTGIVVTKTVEAEIAKGVSDQTKVPSTVTCQGDPIRPSTVGSTFDCTAKAGDGSSAPIKVNVTDESGGIEWKLAPG